MSVPDITPLGEAIDERISKLEEDNKRAEERYEGDGSDAATWRKVKPNIKRRVAEDCLDDIENIEQLDDLLQVLAEWRRKINSEWAFQTTKAPVDNERNSIKRAEIDIWIRELIDLVPAAEFRTCGICGSNKLPESDRRLKLGFRWRCPEC